MIKKNPEELNYDNLKMARTTEVKVSSIIDAALACITFKNEALLEMMIIDILPTINQTDISQYGMEVGYGDVISAAMTRKEHMDIFIEYVKDLGKWEHDS